MTSFANVAKGVHDAPKRGVKVDTDYATILTDVDEQKAAIIQAVKTNEQEFPALKKSALCKLFFSDL